MEKEDNYSGSFTGLDYSISPRPQHFAKPSIVETCEKDDNNNNNGVVDYMLNNNHHQQMLSSGFCTSSANSLDRLSFADVMQFADFGPKLGLNQTKEETSNNNNNGIIDPIYFLKFPVLNENLDNQDESLMVPHQPVGEDFDDDEEEEDGENNNNVIGSSVQQLQFLGGENDVQKNSRPVMESKNKRKRPRSVKTSEEVESQRMTHIAVERNRRKQMNEHLRVLRSLMPGSYVQRGDQASIIGGAIEFVRELEQLLQCLESQKRRRLYGDNQRPVGGDSNNSAGIIQQPQPPLIFPDPMPLPNDMMKMNVDFDTGLVREETAENKSCLADVEVKLLGFDAIIKILCRRRPGQLIKTIAALEDLQLNILHTNITTIEQTVLYSFNVKVASESGFNAEDIASSVQQIFTFIHANSI